MSYNKIILVGNLTRDCELRYAQSGTAMATVGIATTRKFTANGEKKEEVCFIDVKFFGRSAEVMNQYTRKGSKVLIEGRLTFDQWVDQQGNKRSKHSVIAESMQMLDSKQDTQQEQYQQAPQQDHTAYQPKMQRAQQTPDMLKQSPDMPNQLPGIDIYENEIPFGYIGMQYPMSIYVI